MQSHSSEISLRTDAINILCLQAHRCTLFPFQATVESLVFAVLHVLATVSDLL